VRGARKKTKHYLPMRKDIVALASVWIQKRVDEAQEVHPDPG
jgi:hypothetical protein